MSSPPRELRHVLVDAAEAEVAEAGIGEVSLRAIARRAGVSHQAPGHVFRDRAGLFTALAERVYGELADALEAARAGAGDDAAAALAACGVAYVAFAQERGAVFSVIVRPELWNADDPGLAAARARAWAVLERSVAGAQDTGWAAGVDRRTMMLLCISMVHGLASLARDGVLAVDEPGATADDVARRITGALAVLGAG
ncbi:TetR/AcrR family transcriptional regulator [Patulibacter minatonensis]|uniref:TetR/AcrR family transcriptional regulator n=1 Tax=Patulibacter minatonensis TaxID=298163 RepID=UPI00047DFD98|nr:TetR/AcrR family transcriptional regulator [Patulibacter minatonensis]